MSKKNDIIETPDLLLSDLREMISDAREQVAQVANAALTTLSWKIGKRVYHEILDGKRADYGKQIVASVGRQLASEYGTGFGEKNLRRMIQFAEAFPDEEIVAALRRQFGWTHFRTLIPLQAPLKRDFYAEMCRVELTALRADDQLSPALVFRDPYILDFLGLKDRYLEKDLEDTILREIEGFLLELGDGFAFLARQKRFEIDHDDFYIDLLFFHRRLRRLIAIDLKLGDFKAEYKGQMEIYLRWLAKHEQKPGEETPLGLILSAGKKEEQIELLELGQSGIHVAEYLTVLPPRELLQQKLHAAIQTSRARLAAVKPSTSKEGGLPSPPNGLENPPSYKAKGGEQ